MKIYKWILMVLILMSLNLNAEEKDVPQEDVSPEKKVISSVKKMINFIRYKRNEEAIALVDVALFSKNLVKNYYNSISDGDKKELESAMRTYMINKSFPIAMKYFDKVDINYEKPVIKGKEAILGSSVLYRGSEKITFSWVLTEKDGKFLVSDFISEGKRVTELNRTKNIEPMVKQKGIKEVIKTIKKLSKE